MALAGTVAFTSCSKDDDDSEAIVGTWVSESSVSINGGAQQTDREVWKFNADSTGSYSDSSNGTVEEESDFKWTKKDSVYQVDYSNVDIADEAFGIGELLGQQTLEDSEGYMIAVRE